MEKFLLSNKKLHEELLKSLKEFHVVNRSTAQFTLASSMTNVALLIGSLVHRIFHFPFNPKMSILTFVVGSMSVVVPLIALSYMKRTTNEISRNVRKRNRFLMDLTVADRRGNWIDLKVPGLFPYGISLNSDNKLSSKEIANFEDRHTWRIDLCSSIILTNIQKDVTLLKDENFLSKVKMFVESPVSEIWWNRIKLKKLIEEVRKKTDNLPAEKFMSGHENFVCRTAQYLYPVIIPWMVSPWHSEHMRYLCGSISGLLAGLDLGNDYNEEFEDLKKLSQIFKKDLKEMTKLCEMINDGDD